MRALDNLRLAVKLPIILGTLVLVALLAMEHGQISNRWPVLAQRSRAASSN